MYRIKIILMLSTIIPSLDCCSSRTLFTRKPINFYSNAELSMQKSNQFQQNDSKDSPPPSSVVLPPQLTSGDDQTTLSYRHHHLQHYENSEQSDEEEEHLKLNRSQRSDLQKEEAQLEQTFEEDFTTGNNDSEKSTAASNDASTNVPLTTEDDAQYKLITNILSIECVELLRLEFCLNGGRCFLYPILNQSLTSCECAEGYVGERCEAKSFDFYHPIRPRFVLAKTMIGGPFVFGLAVIDILFLLFLFCKNYNRD